MNNAIIIDKDEMNKAILKVLTSKYKKDCKEEYKMIEEAGYEVCKWDGVFHITNRKLNKVISLYYCDYVYYVGGYKPENRRYGYYAFEHSTQKRTRINDLEEVAKIDFVNCLNTPINTEYYKALDYERSFGPWSYASKLRQLREAKRSLRYETERVEKLKKEMEELQKTLEKAIVDREKEIAKYNSTMKKLGLRK